MPSVGSQTKSLVAFALACLSLPSFGQQSLAYQRRANRREGLQSEFNSKPPYDIRGIFGWEDVSADPGANLKISFYLPKDAKVSAIRAQELRKKKAYLMTPDLPVAGENPGQWATFSPWQVSDVLSKIPIVPSALGVVVNLTVPDVPNVFAPALFYSGEAPTTINAYKVFFATDRPLEKIQCIVTDHTGRKLGCSLPKHETFIPSNTTTPFRIAAADLPDGLLTVTITGEYANDESGDSLHAVLHIYHKRQVVIR